MTTKNQTYTAVSQALAEQGLSLAQLDAYQENGFLVIEDFASAQQCAALMQRADDILAAFDPQEHRSVFSTDNQDRDEYFLESGDQIRCFFEADAFDEQGQLRQAKQHSINKIGHALHELDPVFAQFSQHPALARLAQDLGLQNPRLLQSMYIFKQPKIGGEVGLHQDATFLYTQPITVTGFWFALEDATVENGCLQALAGGHQLGLKQRYYRRPQGGTDFETLDPSPYPQAAALECLPVKAGSLVVLHGLLPHFSAANRSSRSRQAYALHCIDAAADYPADNWLQRAQPIPGFVPVPLN